jgi:hypothetical protein
MDVLNIGSCRFTADALPDVMRLIESTSLKTIVMNGNSAAFGDANANQQFVAQLFRSTTIQELTGIAAPRTLAARQR